MPVLCVLLQLYQYNNESLLVQTSTSFTSEQIEVIVMSKFAAMAMSYMVKDTLFWTFEYNNSNIIQ